MPWTLRRGVMAVLVLAVLLPRQAAARAVADREAAVAAAFDRLRDDPLRLRAFLAAMPKGGDLHNHLGGAVYAENVIARAAEGGLCIDIGVHAFVLPPCTQDRPRADRALAEQPGLSDAMIDALSMRNFTPQPGDRSGHDHFFAVFDKLRAATEDAGPQLAEEATRAAAEHIDYLEIIWVPRLREATALAGKIAWDSADFARDLAALRAGLTVVVAQARADTDLAEARMRAGLGCAAAPAPPGCAVTIRYLPYGLRSLAPQAVFAQLAFGFALAQADPRFVGVNIVAPEDNRVALRDYTLHMRMLGFLHAAYPGVKLSLHAGELAFGQVPPEALRFHIRQAVEVAGASRIGHGTSVMYEDDPAGLLAEMARRGVAVEINQTSNAQILGVAGADHPFASYRAAGVPVVISTDDEGIERTDLTQEFCRAVQTWHLGYRDLKALARASLRTSFLPGAALTIAADGAPRAPTPVLLAASEKARAQWRLETEFADFERRLP